MSGKLTVIMSTYNAGEFLNEALESISKQTFEDFTVKIIDDNSTDHTVSIINEWSEKDSRIELVKVNKENCGLTRNLNYLINLSESKFIARMDSDDIALPERFEKQFQFLEKNPEISVLGTWAFNVNEQGKILNKRYVPIDINGIKKMIGKANPIIHPTAMMRTEQIRSVGGYNENFRVAQDYELWFRCLSKGLLLANLPEFLFKYRVIEGHVSKRKMSHRILDAKIRWRGTGLLMFPLQSRVLYTAIPIVLGLMPDFLKKIALRFSKHLDPRQRLGVKEENVSRSRGL